MVSKWCSPGSDLWRCDSGSVSDHTEKEFAQGSGSYRTHDIRAAYLERIIGDVKLASDQNRG
jgi:hypothetical protein